MTIEEELTSVIQKNLPAQVGDLLQKRLKLIPSLEKELTSTTEKYTECKALNDKQAKRILELESKIQDQKQIDINLEVIKKETLRLDLAISEIKREEAEKRAQGIYDLVSLVFRNPTYTSHQNENESGYSGNTSNSSNKTKTITQTII